VVNLKFEKDFSARNDVVHPVRLEKGNCTQFKLELDPETAIQVGCNPHAGEIEIFNIKKTGSFTTLLVTLRKYFSFKSGPYVFRPSYGTIQNPISLSKPSQLMYIEVWNGKTLFQIKFAYRGHSITLRKLPSYTSSKLL